MAQEDGITRAQSRALKQLAADVAKCVDHGPSKRVLSHLIDICGVFNYPTVGQGAEYQSGRRSVGLDIITMLQSHEPTAFIQMQQEILNARQRADEQTQREVTDDTTD